MVGQAVRKTPLNSFRRFDTCDVDEAREIVARHFCSHRLERLSARDGFDACQNRVGGQHVSLNYIRYGADVVIEPGELSDFFLVQVPIAGTAQIENGCQSVFSTPGMASILNPDRYTSMRWHAGCEQVLLQIDRTYMQAVAARMTGMPVHEVRFKPDFNLASPEGLAWARTFRGIVAAAEDGSAFQSSDQFRQRHLEEGLIASLLTAQPNTVSPLLKRDGRSTPPAIFRRALSMISDRFADDISLLDICTYAGTTPRNLQLIFKREVDCSPIQYLHQSRLNFARHLLLSGNGNQSIAEVADNSGHRHFGRFSVAYKRQFGETPRDTLRSRQFG
ncbi:MAG: AraC family transcriptional regulator [Roseibium sp.]|nr:AraC family transcriptional regulator [Roseibium sp.]